MNWSEVPAPPDGWGGHDESWELPLNLADGSYAIIFRAWGYTGPIAGAEACVSFAVDTASQFGIFTLENGATTTFSNSVTTNASLGNITAPVEMHFSYDFGLSWSNWEPFSERKTLLLPSGSGPRTVYVEYRGANSKVLELSDSIELLRTPVTAKVTLQLSGLKNEALTLGRSVTASGKAMPFSLAGGKVKLTAQRKMGAKWVKAKTASVNISSAGAYSWRYKPTKKGAYRMQAVIAKIAANTAAATKWSAVNVK